MVMRIPVGASRELQALLLALRGARTDVNRQVRQHSREVIGPVYKRELAERVTSRVETRVIYDSARASVSNQNVRLTAATSKRKLSGGLVPARDFSAVEFGMNSGKTVDVTATSTRGKRYSYTRSMGSRFRPNRRGGYVFYPSIANIAPRIISLWIQTAVRTLGDAIDGKGR